MGSPYFSFYFLSAMYRAGMLDAVLKPGRAEFEWTAGGRHKLAIRKT